MSKPVSRVEQDSPLLYVQQRLKDYFGLGEAVSVFAQAFNTYSKSMEKVVQPVDLTLSQYLTLWILMVADKPMTVTEISRLLPLQIHSVSSLITKLQQRKLIKRRRSKTDKRSVEVTLTPGGQQIMREILPTVFALNAYVFDEFSETEMRQITKLTRKMRNAAVSWLGVNRGHVEKAVRQFMPQVKSESTGVRVRKRKLRTPDI